MDEHQLVMAFGALLALIGLAIFVTGRHGTGTNTIRITGFGEVTLSTPGLVPFAFGCLMIILALAIGKEPAGSAPPASEAAVAEPAPSDSPAAPAPAPPPAPAPEDDAEISTVPYFPNQSEPGFQPAE